MQRGLAVVDAALGVDGDEDILIEARGVVGRGHAKKAARADPPRRPAGEIFARNGGEGRLDSRVADAGAPGDLSRVSAPAFGESIRHAIPPALHCLQ